MEGTDEPAVGRSFGPAQRIEGAGADGQTTRIIGTYYGIGVGVDEPTIVSDGDGTLLMSARNINFNRTSPEQAVFDAGTRIMRSLDGMAWEDVTAYAGPVNQIPATLDPLLVIDPWTDRVFRFENQLNCMVLQWTDDAGTTWSPPIPVCAESPVVQDHQTLVAYPPPSGISTVGYPNVLTYCVYRGLDFPTCSSSFDGGISWTPMAPGASLDRGSCAHNHGHMVATEGVVFRPGLGCDGATVWRSVDAGLTWTEHVIGGTVLGHEVRLALDESGNLFAFWVGEDGRAYFSTSRDQGNTWSAIVDVTGTGLTATGFPAIAAGAEGHVVLAYIGTTIGRYGSHGDRTTWHGYLAVITDALDAMNIQTVRVNAADDPLHKGPCELRCSGFGDFIGVTIDPTGRPWAAMAWNRQESVPIHPGVPAMAAEGPLE